MSTAVRCKVCRRKNTMQEVRADGQIAFMCSNCFWLDPESIRDIEEGEEPAEKSTE